MLQKTGSKRVIVKSTYKLKDLQSSKERTIEQPSIERQLYVEGVSSRYHKDHSPLLIQTKDFENPLH